MKKIKKAMALSLALAMGLSLAACGKDKKDDSSDNNQSSNSGTNTDSNTGSSDVEDGKVYNVYVWNTEFKERVEEFYPGYEKTDETSGKIGDVTVKWNITPSDDGAYQNNLDETLLNQSSAAANDKIDLFLVEADYALKYVDTDFTMSMADIGITDADLSKQYQYTKDVMTDSNGVLKGVSWQGCPGALFYNRAIAIDVLGSDDPAQVQEAVKDWDAFMATADAMKAKGYMMSSCTMDTYRVFSNNVTSKWVDADQNVQIDPNIEKWVETAKALLDAGETINADLWSDDWKIGFYPEGKVFCYFGPMWLINFCMSAEDPASVAAQGGFGACPGPQGFFWGGTWICAATGSDNTDITADIIKKLCTDDTIMYDIATKKDEFVNNKDVIAQIAASDEIGAATLGGQNPYGMLAEGAEKIDLSNCTGYDQGCNEEFQKAMSDYFNGNCTYEEAVEVFMNNIAERYPALNQ